MGDRRTLIPPALGARLSRRAALGLSCLFWGALGALLALDYWRPVLTIDHTGAFLGFLIAGIASAFSHIASAAVTIAVTIAQAAVMIALAIAQFAVQVGTVFVKIFDLLRGFYTNALKPFVEWSWRQIDRLQGWLERTFRPVYEFLEKVRKQIDAIYTKWFKPIFDTIDATRQILQLLAYLRVPFARELDAAIAKLESRLLWPIQQLYYRLNEVIGWIDRIVTLDGFFQRVTLIRSLMRYQVDALKVWWTSIHKPLTGAKKDEYERPLETRSVEAVTADVSAYVRDRNHPDRGRINEYVLDVRLWLEREGRLQAP